MLQKGNRAPDFTLYNSDKKQVTLSELRGDHVLLLFFPLAFTSVCSAELCSVRDNMAIYNNLNIKVYGISVDSPYTLGKYKEELGLDFPLLSDFNKTVSRDYGSLYEKFSMEMLGVSKRSAFLIDAEGMIQYAEVLENPTEQPNFKAIQEELSIFTK